LSERALPAPGAAITAGGVEIGRLGSVAENRGLALLRLDRAAELTDRGEAIRAGNVPVRIVLPSWANFSLAPAAAGTPA
jgi:folate-binding Fe-S cluster repair protein YgfZ